MVAGYDIAMTLLTLHYITTKDWILRSRCLSVKNLEIQEEHKDHTAASTAAVVTTELRKNGIHISQVYYATTDNTNAIPSTTRILQVNWLGCASHKLQLTIKAALKAQEYIKTLLGFSIHLLCIICTA